MANTIKFNSHLHPDKSSLSHGRYSKQSGESVKLFTSLHSTFNQPKLHNFIHCQPRHVGTSRRVKKNNQFLTLVCRSTTTDSGLLKAQELTKWLTDNGFPPQPVEIRDAGALGRGCFAIRPIKRGEPLLSIPENFSVSSFDVSSHPVVAELAQGRSELVGLTLWLLHESSSDTSPWSPFLEALKDERAARLAPLTWDPQVQEDLLKGSPVLGELRNRTKALEAEFVSLEEGFFQKDPERFPAAVFSLPAFKAAFSLVLSRVAYLPAADTLALIPFADMVNHQSDCSAELDFQAGEDAIVLIADRDYSAGDQIWANYGRGKTNAELFINYGFVPEKNEADFLDLTVGLVTLDRLYSMKKQLVEEVGFTASQPFPLFLDKLPTQLLTYVRLARLQDPALFAKISFERDMMLDEANEYETLTLLIGECREKLAAYKGGLEDDLQLLKKKDIPAMEKLAAQLRLSEKKILTAAMGALRNRLAPIRGIPTKGGAMQDPNSDIKEIFDAMEVGLSAPRKLLSSIFKKKN